MTPSRRRLLQSAAACAAVPALSAAPDAPAAARPRIRLAVSSYSYWHFRGPKVTMEQVIDDAARLGFDGVELLHRQMGDESPAALNALKRRAFQAGLDLVMLSIHQDFVSPKPEEIREAVAHTKRCIGLAERMGIPAIRLNSGRWGTIPDFNDLMKVKGDEPPLPGYTDKDGIAWCVEAIGQCLPAAEQAGVVLALENHWGLTTKTDTLLEIWRTVNSPWLGINLDTGNFPGDPYPEIERLAPHATIVQAKTYHGGGEWYTLDLDYARIAGILRKAGFKGYVSLEMEGKEPAATAVPKSLETLRRAFA